MSYLLLNNSVLYFEILALFIALFISLKTRKQNHLLICFYLFVVCTTEVIGRIPSDNNIWLYTGHETIHVCILYIFYYINIKNRMARVLILILALAFIILWTYELIDNQWTFVRFFETTFGFTSLTIGLLAIIYIINIVLSGTQNQGQFVFWVSIGFIIYYLCNLPFTVLSNILDQMEGGRILRYIQPITSITLYSLISLGYLWRRNHSHI